MVMQERKSPDFRSLEVGIYIHVPLTKKNTKFLEKLQVGSN